MFQIKMKCDVNADLYECFCRSKHFTYDFNLLCFTIYALSESFSRFDAFSFTTSELKLI